MNERRDDTTKPETESPPAHKQGSYYYDDATGYEIYKPDEDEEDLKEVDEAESKDERRASRDERAKPTHELRPTD